MLMVLHKTAMIAYQYID